MQGSRHAWPILSIIRPDTLPAKFELPVVSKPRFNSGLVAGQLLSGSLVPECASIATPHCTRRRQSRRRYRSRISLLTHHAHDGRAAANHIELTRRRAAYVDNSTTTIRPAVGDANDDSLAIANVGHQHHGAERQRPMSRGKPGRASHFPACGPPAAIECGKTAFSVNRTDRYRRESRYQCEFDQHHPN